MELGQTHVLDKPRRAGQVAVQWRNKPDDFYKGLDTRWHHYTWMSLDDAKAFLTDLQ